MVGSCVYRQWPEIERHLAVVPIHTLTASWFPQCISPAQSCMLSLTLGLFSRLLCSDSSPSQPRLADRIACFIQSERYLKPPVPFKVPNDGITPTWVLKLCQRGFLGIIIP